MFIKQWFGLCRLLLLLFTGVGAVIVLTVLVVVATGATRRNRQGTYGFTLSAAKDVEHGDFDNPMHSTRERNVAFDNPMSVFKPARPYLLTALYLPCSFGSACVCMLLFRGSIVKLLPSVGWCVAHSLFTSALT